MIPLPEQIGSCRFGRRGDWITVQCPPEYDPLMEQAGGVRDHSDASRWLLRSNRIWPVLRALRRNTDQSAPRDRPGRKAT
jgi:hypothetical protein